MTAFNEKPQTFFSEDTKNIIDKLGTQEYVVLVGRNNCGKTFILKKIGEQLGQSASYLGPARYQNFNLLNLFAPQSDKKERRYREFLQMVRQEQNMDNSPVNLQQSIAEMSDVERDVLAEIMQKLLGVTLEWPQTVPNNSMSQKYVSCNGHNLSYTSSGLRLIITIVTCLLDTDFDTFLIDEPELGISPEAQGVLADFLFDKEHRKKYFSHIKSLIFATHSTVFLDRARVKSNYMVSKNGDEICVKQVKTQSDFNSVHFFLLGNRFETLYLPSGIVIVEGKSDDKFIQRSLSLLYPNTQLSVIPANSDSRIKEVLNIAKGLFTDLQRSPYRDRIIIVLDKIHSSTLPGELKSMGIPAENIVIWPKNGIEFYYPPTVVDQIFGEGNEIVIDGDNISRNGITHKKNDLADLVVEKLNADTPMNKDFEDLFLSRINQLSPA